MTTRVVVTVDLGDGAFNSTRSESETLTWTGVLHDGNPRYSAKELDAALSEASAALVAKVTRLRGDIRIDDAAVAKTVRVEAWPR